MGNETMVYQANYLINHRQNMTRDENRFFLTLVSKIGKDDNQLTYRVPVSMFAETWNVDRSAMYRKVKDSLESLRKKGVRIESINEKGKKVAFGCGFISDYVYVEGEAVAEVSISAKFKPYLLELKKAYTGYKLEQVVKLDAAGAGYTTIRVYEICSEWAYKGFVNYTVEELKQILDIKGKYPQLYNFKRYIIEPAQDLINKVTDLQVSYSVTGRGAKAAITLTVSKAVISNVEVPIAEPDNVPDIPQPQPQEEPLPPLPYDLELEGGFVEKNPHEGLVDMVCTELKALPNYEVTTEKAEYLLQLVLNQDISDYVSVSDYVRTNVLYARKQWKRVKKSQDGYLQDVFVNNRGEWMPKGY